MKRQHSSLKTPARSAFKTGSSRVRRRWQTLGLVGGVVVLLVAHTYGEEKGEEVIRIISARKATPRERMFYEEAQ